MRRIAFVVPGQIETRTGGYQYDRCMMSALRERGVRIDLVQLDGSFPYPTPAALDQASSALRSLPPGTVALVDSLALGAMPDVIEREAHRLTVVALMHLPLAATFGLDPEVAARFEMLERRSLAAASLIVLTGRAAMPMLARYSLPNHCMVVVEPGTDAPAGIRDRGAPRSPHEVALLSVGTITAGKGHTWLVEALAAIGLPWRLTCAGSLTRDPRAADELRAVIARRGLERRVLLTGELDAAALAAEYDRADLFVLTTRQETYGMAVAEALAHGLPVVATATGAIPDLIGADAGIVVPCDDTGSLVAALTRVIGDAPFRAELARGAIRRRTQLPTWRDAAARMDAALCALPVHG
jgi:glycosyltransferase involved in cell wall biosynthesis